MNNDPKTDLAAAEAFTDKYQYEPHDVWANGSMDPVFRDGQWGKKGGDPRCWGECSHHDRVTRWFQCGRPGKVRLADGSTWCGIHSPEAVEKRDQKTTARYQAWEEKWKAKKIQYEREAKEREILPLLLNALNDIQNGHNDPRVLSQEILALWPYPIPRKPLPSK